MNAKEREIPPCFLLGEGGDEERTRGRRICKKTAKGIPSGGCPWPVNKSKGLTTKRAQMIIKKKGES